MMRLDRQEDVKMETTLSKGTSSSHRGFIVAGILLLQALLMSAAFVGGRLIASQQLGANGQINSLSSPLPNASPAGSGTVQKVGDNTITLARGSGGGLGQPPGSAGQTVASTTSQTQVAVTPETRYFKSTSAGMPGMPGESSAQNQMQVRQATLSDVKVGNTVTVWGTKDGDRVAAEVVYVQTFGR